MQMFIWRSELLQEYGPGHLIAVAATEDEARNIVRAHFDEWVKEHREWWLIPSDWDDESEIEKGKALLEKDLFAPPTIVSVLYIRGSE